MGMLDEKKFVRGSHEGGSRQGERFVVSMLDGRMMLLVVVGLMVGSAAAAGGDPVHRHPGLASSAPWYIPLILLHLFCP